MEQTTTQICWFISVNALNLGLWTFALRAAPVSDDYGLDGRSDALSSRRWCHRRAVMTESRLALREMSPNVAWFTSGLLNCTGEIMGAGREITGSKEKHRVAVAKL